MLEGQVEPFGKESMSFKKDRRAKVYEAYVPGKGEGYYGVTLTRQFRR